MRAFPILCIVLQIIAIGRTESGDFGRTCVILRIRNLIFLVQNVNYYSKDSHKIDLKTF